MLSRVLTRTEQGLLLAIFASAAIGGVSLYYYRHTAQPAAPVIQPAPNPVTAVQAPAIPSAPPAATPPPAGPEPEPVVVAPDPSVPEIAISVAGAVNRPGLYRLPHDARLQDAIAAAGGIGSDGDASGLNLAAPLMDGSTLTIPAHASSRREGDRLTLHGGTSAMELNPPQYTLSGWKSDAEPRALPADATQRHDAKETNESQETGEKTTPAKHGSIDLNTATATELDSLPGIGPKLAGEIIAYRTQTPFTTVDDLTKVAGIGERKVDVIRSLVSVNGMDSAAPETKPGKTAKPKRRSAAKNTAE